jgi:SAM-dependent methyltransferase
MDDVAEFFDRTVGTYDAVLEGVESAAGGWGGGDVAFYRELAREAERSEASGRANRDAVSGTADGPALEVGVGTGRVYLDLLAAGLDVDGIDVSAGMLDRLREKAAAEGLAPSVWQADVTELEADREYGLVYCPARAFNHLDSLDAQRAATERAYESLADGGRFALNTFVPDPEFLAEHYGEWDGSEVTVDGETYRVESRTDLADPVELVASYRKRVRQDGETVAEVETPLALVPRRQFELLFERAGFAEWTFHGGFEGDPLESSEQELVAVARK